MRFAHDVHRGQVDKTGVPYIYHPMAVAERVSREWGEDMPSYAETEICVALLHDVLEDNPSMTASTLITWGIPSNIASLVETITRRKGEPYEQYIKRCKADPITMRVKMADVEHNLQRIEFVPRQDQDRLQTKYNKALAMLCLPE
jgi:(p)ppGpp synthase/HD superfamily hydrolase